MNTIYSQVNALVGKSCLEIWLHLIGLPLEQAGDDNEDDAAKAFLIGICSLDAKSFRGRNAYGVILVGEDGAVATLHNLATLAPAFLNIALEELTNPVVRARLLDVLWCINPKTADLAGSLSESISAARHLVDANNVRAGLKILDRVIDVMLMTRRQEDFQFAVAEIANAVWSRGFATSDLITAAEALRLLDRMSDISLPAKLASTMESLFDRAEAAPFEVHDLFPRLLKLFGLPREASVEMRERAALAMEKAATSSRDGSRALFLKSAIEFSSESPHLSALTERLTARLQADSFRDLFGLRTFSHEINLTAMVANALRHLKGATFGNFVFRFSELGAENDLPRVRADAEDYLRSGFLHSMITATQLDEGGRQVYSVPGSFGTNEEFEKRVRYQMSYQEGLNRQLFCAGELMPALRFSRTSFLFSEDTMLTLVSASNFVRQGRAIAFAAGLDAFLRLEFVAASRILVPEIEAGIRHLLEIKGCNPYDRDEDGNFSAQGLGAMLSRHTDILEKTVGADLVFKIEDLLIYPGGPSVRNTIAHGLGSRSGNDHDSIAASHLALQLCCGFVPREHRQELIDIIDKLTEGVFEYPKEAEGSYEAEAQPIGDDK